MRLLKLVFLFFYLTTPNIFSFAQQQVALNGQKETIYPIDVQHIYETNDLVPLKTILENKSVIGMGEATHGTKEFFEIKGKMFRYLVQEHGVKVFGIEATYAGCLYINDYITEGIGNLDSVLNRLEFWTWHTQEVKELIKWMRDYNVNKQDADKIFFYGFDMQSIVAPTNYLHDYIKLKYPQHLESFKNLIAPVYNRQREIYNQSLSSNRNAIADTLTTVASAMEAWFVQKNLLAKEENTDKKERQLKLCFQNFKEAVMMLKAKNGFSFRDSCMANMVQTIKNLEKGKIFLWAHNGHIMTGTPYGTRLNVMGNHLKNMFGDQYYNIGFVFHRGTFNAVKQQRSKTSKGVSGGLGMCAVSSSPKGSIAGQFSRLHYPSFFIDLAGTQNKLFTTTQMAYNIGAIFIGRERSFGRFTPAQSYDGIVYVENTNASQLLPFR